MSYSTPRAVLEAYIDGSRDLDRAKLETCFHPKAVMNGFLMGQAVVGSPEPFLNDIDRMAREGVRNEGYQAEIDGLVVQGSVASATIAMAGLAGLTFKDFMHVVEEDGQWSIISKLFTTV